MKRVLILAVLFAVLASGCTPTAVRKTETTPTANNYIGKNSLYATLDKAGEKYILAKISNIGPLTFKLNDLSSSFDTETYKCTFLYGKLFSGHEDKCRDDEKTFRKIKFDAAVTGGLAVHTLGWSALLGVTSNNSIFDKEAYYKAVEDGLNNSGINRQELLIEYDNFVDSVNILRNQYSSEYERYLKNNIKIVHQIEDESGFYKNDIVLSSLYSVRQNDVPKTVKVEFNPSVEPYKSVFNNLLKDYEDKLKSITSNYQMHYKSSQKVKDYIVDMTAPSHIYYKKGETQNISVIFTIRSKDFKGIFPKYTNEDNSLQVDFDGKGIRFINKTDKFLQIKTISTYYNGEVSIFSFGEREIELAPHATTKESLPIGRYITPAIEKISEYRNMTKDSALQQNISFGFAVKYRLVEQNIDKTLYKRNKYNLYDVLSSM